MKFAKNKILRYVLILAAIGTIVGLMNTIVVVTTYLAERGKIEVLFPLIYEMTGGYSFAILLPIMFWVFTKYPLTKKNFSMRIPLYLLAAAPLGIVHTYIMYGSRQVIFDIAGWGTYDYGIMPYRFLMEYIKMVMGLSSFYVIYYYIKSNKEREKAKLREYQLEEQLTQARLDMLQSQLNPHFLFNTLNVISSTMYDDIHAADKMIADLSRLLRASLRSGDSGTHTLGKELELLDLYLNIMRARFSERLKTEININSEFYDIEVPQFVLQPLVENSIKHCSTQQGVVKIEIDGECSDEKFILHISDNGPGIPENEADVMHAGVGLSNTNERLKSLYNDDFVFKLENISSGGLKITISIPLNGNYNGKD